MPEQTKEPTLKELKELALEMGADSDLLETFTIKSQVEAYLKVLETQTKQRINTQSVIESDRRADRSWMNSKKSMQEQLAAQTKISVQIPLDRAVGERPGVVRQTKNAQTGIIEFEHISGAVQPVVLNGYKYLVPKGIRVEVPQQVAAIIDEKETVNNNLGADYLVDNISAKIDPETGKHKDASNLM